MATLSISCLGVDGLCITCHIHYEIITDHKSVFDNGCFAVDIIVCNGDHGNLRS